MRLAKWYLGLAPTSAPSYWTTPKLLERARMEYEDEVSGGFLKWFPSLSVVGKDVFDVGSGYGGRAVRLAELGARSVTGLEPSHRHCDEGRAFARSRDCGTVRFVEGVGERLPFPDQSFDVVTSYDVFEHVADLRAVLHECVRVLRPGGEISAVFPPFYHPTGAHLDAWASRMPWPQVFFRPRTLMRAALALGNGFQPLPLRPSDKLWMLNGATVASVKRLVRDLDADVTLNLAPLFSPLNEKWERWRMKYYAPLVAPLRFVPGVRELFVHRIVMRARKRA
jgi:SAM-dependent methyltransferase